MWMRSKGCSMLPGLMHDEHLPTEQLPKMHAVNVAALLQYVVTGRQQVAKRQQQRSKAASTVSARVLEQQG